LKLNLFFFIMDMLTVLAYPIIFMLNKVHQISKLKENTTLVSLLVVSPIKSGR